MLISRIAILCSSTCLLTPFTFPQDDSPDPGKSEEKPSAERREKEGGEDEARREKDAAREEQVRVSREKQNELRELRQELARTMKEMAELKRVGRLDELERVSKNMVDIQRKLKRQAQDMAGQKLDKARSDVLRMAAREREKGREDVARKLEEKAKGLEKRREKLGAGEGEEDGDERALLEKTLAGAREKRNALREAGKEEETVAAQKVVDDLKDRIARLEEPGEGEDRREERDPPRENAKDKEPGRDRLGPEGHRGPAEEVHIVREHLRRIEEILGRLEGGR